MAYYISVSHSNLVHLPINLETEKLKTIIFLLSCVCLWKVTHSRLEPLVGYPEGVLKSIMDGILCLLTQANQHFGGQFLGHQHTAAEAGIPGS